MAGVIFAVNILEGNKVEPKERKAQKEQKEESVEKKEEKSRNVILTKSRSLEYEFLSYEMVEDTEIEKQNTYKAEYFYQGKVPDADYQEEVIDYERAEKECPELRDIWDKDNSDKYTDDEIVEIYNKYIGEYTSMQHIKTKYLFLKCRITNLRDKSVEEALYLQHGIVSGDGKKFIYSDRNVYFDKSQHTEETEGEREHHFFFYNFKPGETLECTLGVEIRQKYDGDEEYYIGFEPLDWDENTGWPDKEPRMINLKEIRNKGGDAAQS